jgi:hypothetical protein
MSMPQQLPQVAIRAKYSVLNRKRHSLGKACNLTVRRDHRNTLRLAGLRCRSYIDGVIGDVALAKARLT